MSLLDARWALPNARPVQPLYLPPRQTIARPAASGAVVGVFPIWAGRALFGLRLLPPDPVLQATQLRR